VPTGTRSLALLCDDPDAPAGIWHHWAAYDIPSTLTTLAQRAASDAEKLGFKQAINDFHRCQLRNLYVEMGSFLPQSCRFRKVS
jgi:phosphatidylethanolamine-binding protein (PEBP) family uncharacterized protein